MVGHDHISLKSREHPQSVQRDVIGSCSQVRHATPEPQRIRRFGEDYGDRPYHAIALLLMAPLCPDRSPEGKSFRRYFVWVGCCVLEPGGHHPLRKLVELSR